MSDNEEKTSISPDLSKYQTSRSASGAKTMHSGDEVARLLEGMTLEEVKDIAVNLIGDPGLETKYSHLNAGQQRMNLGNRIRGFVNKVNKEIEKAEAKNSSLGDDEKPVKVPASPMDKLNKVASKHVKAKEARIKDAEEAKAKAEVERAEKAKEKEAKAAVKKTKKKTKKEESEG